MSDMHRMVEAKAANYSSSDPLDLGEALWISHWHLQETWAQHVCQESLTQLERLATHGYFATSER